VTPRDRAILDAFTASAMSVREIARRFETSDTYVYRLAKRNGAQRADADDVAGRIAATVQRHVAEHATGRPLTSADDVQTAFIEATATVIGRQRADQRAARVTVQRVLDRLTQMMDRAPDIEATLTALGGAAMALDDAEIRRAVLATLAALQVEQLAKTARQLVASLRDLDAIERIAHGIKDAKTPEQAGGDDLRRMMDELDGADTGFGG
jgi:hypothetical protein